MENPAASKKSKKKKNVHRPNIEEDDILIDNSRNKKKAKREFSLINTNEVKDEEVDLQSCTDEHQSPLINKDIDGDSWTKEDYLELIKRMQSQLPKTDIISFTRRIEKLDWNQVQFGYHSLEECREKWKILRGKVRHFRILSEILRDAKTWAESPSSAPIHKKKVRHPEQPARPLSSYMLFYMDKKNKIIKKYPHLKLTEISRLVGERYNALSEKKKAGYIEKAKLMQDEYKQSLTKFYEKYPQFLQVSKKEANKTKKPLSPFKLYLKERLQKHQKDEHFIQHDFVEKYKEKWKMLSTKKKVSWIRLAKSEEDKYLELLREDLNEDENKATSTYKTVISKEENAILDRIAGKPEKPPNSAYSLFSRLMLQNKEDNFVEGAPKNRMKEIASKWKDVPEEQKKAYSEEVQHMHDIFKLEFANYLESLPEDKRAEELAKVQPKKRKLRQKAVKKESITSSIPKQDLFKHEPEKPPVTAWDLYKTEFCHKNSYLPIKTACKNAANTWKNLSRKEVEKYKKRHEQLKEKYMVDFEAFLKSLSEQELKEYSLKSNTSREHELNEESGEEESSEVEGDDDSDVASNSYESDSGVSEEA